jgi:processive 1,2-diacylglycerol beta-glucosyltransferase
MKIIIAYASAGTGHKRAAESIYNYFREHRRNLDIKLIDTLEETTPPFKNLYSHGYRFLVYRAIWLWRLSFQITDIKCLRRSNRILAFFIHRLNTIGFSRFLIQEKADIVISTHFLPSEVVGYLKTTGKINSKAVTVITDFGVHSAWISPMTDLYVAASDFTKEQLMLHGIEEDRIRVWGIPVDSKFLKEYDRGALAKKLDIENKFTVLIVTGSFGIGPIENIVNALYKKTQVLAVCAKNKKLFKRLKQKNYPNVKVYGFIDNLPELMSVSDVVIAKPGGMNISEILAMEVAPIFISAIPGQESENIKALERHKVGIYPRNIEEIRNIISDYQEHPEKLKMARENTRFIRKPFAAEDLCNALC